MRQGQGQGCSLPAGRRTGARQGAVRGDDGFVLLESIVSITLITVIMAALTSLFVAVTRVDSAQRARQVAVQVADSTTSYVRSLPSSDLVTGRTAAAVDAQWSAAPADVLPYLAAMEKAVAPGTPVLPLTLDPQVVHGIRYNVNVYLGWCRTTSVLGSAACVTPVTAAPVHDQLRAVIGVSWPDRDCAPLGASGTPTCSYVSSTLISTLTDPVFTLNQQAPTLPVITLPSFTGYAVGDKVDDLQMAVAPGTGVPVFTWSTTGGSWPAGVSMDPTGHVTGTLAAASSPSITVTVTDAFVRPVSATFTWAVLAALTASGPPTRDDVLGSAIPSLTLGAAGGAGAPYSWSDPQGTLPPGLTVNATTGVVSGTPTAGATLYPATYAVLLTVTDLTTTRRATLPIVWTIRYTPVSVTAPGPRTDTVGRPVTAFALKAVGGTGSYTWSSTPLPPGLTLSSSTGLVSGTPTTPGTTTVTVSATDGRTTSSATSAWSVVAAPTLTSPGDLVSRVGSPVKILLGSTCPAAPCAYTLVSGPPRDLTPGDAAGVSVDGTGLVRGTIGGTAAQYGGVTVTITDKNGSTVASAPFVWTVGSAGDLTATWPVVTSRGGTPDQPLAYTCRSTSSCTVSVTGQPTGVGLSTTPGNATTTHTPISVGPGSGTLYLSGTVAASVPLTSTTVILSITGSSSGTNSGTWTVR